MKKSYEIDMIHGPLLSRMILFAVPLMLSGILQLLFNAADIIVVGRFSGSQALAAVGSTSALINLLVNVSWAFPSARTCSRRVTWARATSGNCTTRCTPPSR